MASTSPRSLRIPTGAPNTRYARASAPGISGQKAIVNVTRKSETSSAIRSSDLRAKMIAPTVHHTDAKMTLMALLYRAQKPSERPSEWSSRTFSGRSRECWLHTPAEAVHTCWSSANRSQAPATKIATASNATTSHTVLARKRLRPRSLGDDEVADRAVTRELPLWP